MKEMFFENQIKNKKPIGNTDYNSGKNSLVNNDENIKYNNNLVNNLRRKIQKQEIDLKFLNEKIKRLEKESFSSINNRNEDKISKLSEREVIAFINIRLTI